MITLGVEQIQIVLQAKELFHVTGSEQSKHGKHTPSRKYHNKCN